MKVERAELQLCPKCGAPAKLHRYDKKYQYECDLCWTRGHRCDTEEEAAKSWNAIRPLQRCPNCGSELVKLNKSRSWVWYECDGDCWTRGEKCHTVEDAAKSWNSLKPTPKKTNHELLQETNIANFAVFLQTWEETHGMRWADMTEDEIINWLGEPADPELEAIVNF